VAAAVCIYTHARAHALTGWISRGMGLDWTVWFGLV
jgi:hypothetical protein